MNLSQKLSWMIMAIPTYIAYVTIGMVKAWITAFTDLRHEWKRCNYQCVRSTSWKSRSDDRVVFKGPGSEFPKKKKRNRRGHRGGRKHKKHGCYGS